MLGDSEEVVIRARRTLINALEVLRPHLDALILVGAQAIYLHTGDAPISVAPFTKDADLAIDSRRLAAEPNIEIALRKAGFSSQPDAIGIWRNSEGDQVDFLVPYGISGGGRRAARLGPQGQHLARKTLGLEGALVDSMLMTLGALDSTDTRRLDVRVAGPGALLVAKLHKIGERVDQAADRQRDKDALDVLRLLQAVSTERLVASLHTQLQQEVSAEVARTALVYLEELFGAATGRGVEMAVRAVGPLDDAVFIRTATVSLVGTLLAATVASES